MPRGGPRKPKSPQPPSGVGRFSSRTDGQSVATPNVLDSAATSQGQGIQWGDRQMLEAAQHAVPLAGVKPSSPAPAQSPQDQGSPAPSGGAGGLPSWLFDQASNRPGEPLTAGMDVGPGAGSEVLPPQPSRTDDAMMVLSMLADQFGDQAAADMLTEMQAANTGGVAPTIPQMPQEPIAPSSPDSINAQMMPMPDQTSADQGQGPIPGEPPTAPQGAPPPQGEVAPAPQAPAPAPAPPP